MTINRRNFLTQSSAALAAGTAASVAFAAETKHRAAIIGHTGAGNYGHSINRIFRDLPGVDTVAVADPVAEGAARVLKLYPGAKSYRDFHEMLDTEQPSLVAVAPRWSERHHEMALAALQSNAHVFCEKPFTVTPAQADELLEESRRRKRKIAVAHQMVFDPNIQKLHASVADGSLIGELVEIRLYGKMDRRAGGEDLIVLGTHLFDMALWFADSKPLWCHARVLENGRPFINDDIRESERERIGPITGRHIHAHFGLANGVDVTFQSRPELQKVTENWGLEFIGTKDRVRVFLDHPTHTYFNGELWPSKDAYPQYRKGEAMDVFNRAATLDWLASIAEDREPVCSGARAALAVEMIHGVFASGRSRQRANLPLENRRHALEI